MSTLPWKMYKPRKKPKLGKLFDTDIVEPGVEFWDWDLKKWEVMPKGSICLGITVSHAKCLDKRNKYRYPKGFVEDPDFWK